MNFAQVEAQTTSSNDEIRFEIEEAYRDFANNLKKGNAAGIVAHYTENAKFYPPNGSLATGKQEISVDLEIKELEVFEEVAYEYGIATVMNQQGNELGQNEYVVLWKKEGDEWKIYRDFIKDKVPE